MAITKTASRRTLREAPEKKLTGNKVDLKTLNDAVKLASEIGLVTVADVIKFLKNEANEGDTLYQALKRYRDELGDDFKIKVEECFSALKECDTTHMEECDTKPAALHEDRYYGGKKELKDDFYRLTHFLSCAGYSEGDATKVKDEIAIAATDGDEKALRKATKEAKTLGYLSTTTDGYIRVAASSQEALNTAREVAADFDCPIEEEHIITSRNGSKCFEIVINPYCGYEYGTDECTAAIAKWTPENQKVYDNRKGKQKSTIADATDDLIDDFDDDDEDEEDFDFDEGCGKGLKEGDCDDCGVDDIDEGCAKNLKEGEGCETCEDTLEECDSTEPLDEGKKEKVCADCGKADPNLLEELDFGWICPACARKHRRLGESLTFIKRIK